MERVRIRQPKSIRRCNRSAELDEASIQARDMTARGRAIRAEIDELLDELNQLLEENER
jgi:Pup-like protein